MKVLVTGGTGFLGSHLLKQLVSNGYEVIILKRSFSDTFRISLLLDQVQTYDIDMVNLSTVFKEHKNMDCIIHTATNYGRDARNISSMVKDNIIFPLKLMELAHKNNVKAFINTDSYFNKNRINYDYLSQYILTKKQLNDWIKVFLQKHSWKVLNVKLEHVYGPMDSLSKFTTFVIDTCLKNKEELKLTKGIQKRDFVYVEDVVKAYLTLLEHIEKIKFGFHEFEAGTGKAVTIRQFVETVHKITNSATILKFGALPLRDNEIMESKANISALTSLGWAPSYNLDSGIKKTINNHA